MEEAKHAQPGFLVNLYDRDGDELSEGIFLYFVDDVIVKVADSPSDFTDFIEYIKGIEQEISENYL